LTLGKNNKQRAGVTEGSFKEGGAGPVALEKAQAATGVWFDELPRASEQGLKGLRERT
jgi:hypothetical protein